MPIVNSIYHSIRLSARRQLR